MQKLSIIVRTELVHCLKSNLVNFWGPFWDIVLTHQYRSVTYLGFCKEAFQTFGKPRCSPPKRLQQPGAIPSYVRLFSIRYCAITTRATSNILHIPVALGITHVDGFHWYLSVCLSVYSHDISKTAIAGITKLKLEVFHHVSWKPTYLGVKRSRSRSAKTSASLDFFCILVSSCFF